jgi:hypothetical protein
MLKLPLGIQNSLIFLKPLITQLRRGQTFHGAFQQSEQMIKGNSKLLGDQKPHQLSGTYTGEDTGLGRSEIDLIYNTIQPNNALKNSILQQKFN